VGNKPIHLVISTIKVIAASLAGPFELSSTGGNAEIISLIGNGRAPKSPMPSRMRLKQVGGILGCREGETGQEREVKRERERELSKHHKVEEKIVSHLLVSEFAEENVGTSGGIVNFNQL
jgi:hypothetical protein